MKTISKLLTYLIIFTITIIPFNSSNAGIGSLITIPETDNQNIFSTLEGFSSVFYVFDLRERETFIQLTWPDLPGFDQSFAAQPGIFAVAHIQIFDVSNNCNENNFFDNYTLNDTHTYNMRDIQTNDGNPSGVVLPDGAYGIVAVSMFAFNSEGESNAAWPVGNLRIVDNNGYEYRTNAQSGSTLGNFDESLNNQLFYSFNFNQQGGVSLSDVMGITLFGIGDDVEDFEWTALPVQFVYSPFDVDIYDLNEVPFSCRDIIFSCVNEENPLVEELLSFAGTANVASFEYGINNAIPHSKGGELLCPGNVIPEGMVVLRPESYPSIFPFEGEGPFFFGYIGLNNGNNRGSFDSFWVPTCTTGTFNNCEPPF